MARTPIVKLYRNPWVATVHDQVVHQILVMAGFEADAELQRLIRTGEVDPARDSFGAVLLDPTRPRSAATLAERVLATIEIGPAGAGFLPNGAAKADAHDRHGRPNGELVSEASHCLGDGDFAWGESAEYKGAIGGGSGLSGRQDRDLVYSMLVRYVDFVSLQRDSWLAERRRQGSHGWYNPANVPGPEYTTLSSLVPIVALDVPTAASVTDTR